MPLFLPCIRRAAPRDSKALPSSSRAQPHTVCSTLTQYGGLATFLCGKKSRHHFGDAANDRLGGPNRMRKLLAVCGTVLFLSLVSAIPSVAGPCSQDSEAPGIFIPDRSCFQLGFGYQYQNYSGIEGRSFHNNGYNIDASLHLFDAITGASGVWRLRLKGPGLLDLEARRVELLLLSTRNRFSWAQALAYRSKAGRGLSPGFMGWWAWSI